MLLLHFVVLLEELIEQHGIHHFVVHALGLAVSIARHESGVDLGHFFGNQAIGGRLAWIDLFLVPIGDWCEPIERFAGFVHRFDVLLVTS